MSRRAVVLSVAAAMLMIFGAVYATFWILGQSTSGTTATLAPAQTLALATTPAAQEVSAESGEGSTEPPPTAGMMGVKLYVLSRDGRRLATEDQEILLDGSLQQQAVRVVEILLRRSAAIPRGVEIRDVFVTSQGVAYVDLSKELIENHPGGSSAEELTVFSLSNTLIVNFPAIKMVKILVEGREVRTIAGHLDLTTPYGRAPAYLQPESERPEPRNEAS